MNITKEEVYNYILKDKQFYSKIPYDNHHFNRVLKTDDIIATTKLLEELVEDNKLMKINGEYILYPQTAKAQVYINAFMKNKNK